MGSIESAVLVLDRARKRTLDVAEEFTLQKVLGKGAAVYTDVVAIGSIAEKVNRAGHEFFARPRLADDEHALLRRRHQPSEAIDFFHRRARADNPR